jgi:hypothetical protein
MIWECLVAYGSR